jgi:hypothetical protein
MTWQEFEQSISRLKAVYGDKAYPKERVEMVYRAVKWTHLAIWEESLNEIIGDCIHPPTVSKIKEIVNLTRKRMSIDDDPFKNLRAEIRELEKTSQCRKCFGSGTLSAHRRDDEFQHLFVFGCDCAAGVKAMLLPENKNKIRQWNLIIEKEWRHDFEAAHDQGTRIEARRATANIFSSKDLNLAIGEKPSPKRESKDEMWEPDR